MKQFLKTVVEDFYYLYIDAPRGVHILEFPSKTNQLIFELTISIKSYTGDSVIGENGYRSLRKAFEYEVFYIVVDPKDINSLEIYFRNFNDIQIKRMENLKKFILDFYSKIDFINLKIKEVE